MQDFQEDEKKNHDRIMLVEDDTTITRVLKRQLERWPACMRQRLSV